MNKVWLLITDLHSNLRGKLIPTRILNREKLRVEFSGVFLNDILDLPVTNLKKAEELVNITGIPSSSEITSTWNKNEYFYFCNGFLDEEGTLPSKICSRSLLCNAVNKAEKMGFKIKCGMELEWTMLKNEKNDINGNEKVPAFGYMQTYAMKHYEDDNMQSFFSELIDKTENLPIQIEALHCEAGSSIFEAALSPGDPVTVADFTQFYRLMIKRMSKRKGMTASFMPKPNANTSGIGAHVHISLYDVNGEKNTELLFSHFLAGILYHMKSSLVMLLPNANSFKRITGDYWTSSHVSYGIDNRSNAIRLVKVSDAKEARLELRVSGGDVNPYLALYYAIQSGIWGIENKVQLTSVGQPEEKIDVFPKTLKEAASFFLEQDSPARKLYGDAFVDHYGQQRVHEALMTETLSRPDGWEHQVF